MRTIKFVLYVKTNMDDSEMDHFFEHFTADLDYMGPHELELIGCGPGHDPDNRPSADIQYIPTGSHWSVEGG